MDGNRADGNLHVNYGFDFAATKVLVCYVCLFFSSAATKVVFIPFPSSMYPLPRHRA